MGVRASLMAQTVKNLPSIQEAQEMQFRFLGQEDSLEEEMVTHSSILAWQIPWTEKPGGLQSMVLQRSQARMNMHAQGRERLMAR